MTTKRNVAAVVAQDEAQTGQEAPGLPVALAELRKALDGVQGHATRLRQAKERVQAAEQREAELREQREVAEDTGAPTIGITQAIEAARVERKDAEARVASLHRKEAELRVAVRIAGGRVRSEAGAEVSRQAAEIAAEHARLFATYSANMRRAAELNTFLPHALRPFDTLQATAMSEKLCFKPDVVVPNIPMEAVSPEVHAVLGAFAAVRQAEAIAAPITEAQAAE